MRKIKKRLWVLCCLACMLILIPSVSHAAVLAKDTTKPRVPVMKRLENFALKDNIVSKLVRSIFVFNNNAPAPPDTTKVSEQRYKSFDNKPIRDIHIVVLNVFGYTVNDPVCRDISFLEKAGNRIHYPTRSWIVRNKLLFEKGEQIDAFKVSESERLLRQSAYIHDAKISVGQADSTDSVDVTVIVQDVWNIGIAVTGDPKVPNGDITFNDINFLGLGQRLDAKLWYDEKYYNRIKFAGSFNVAEIGKTYISSRIYYLTENRDQVYGINFNRPFYSPTTPWAGGGMVELRKIYYDVTTVQDTMRFTGINNIFLQDVWAGYAFKPGPKRSLYQRKSQIVLAGRIVNIAYTDKYKLRSDVAQFFPNQVIYLGSIGYNFREYYRDRFIFGFGRTEDIPLGHSITYTAGVDRTDGLARFYSGLKLAFAKTNSSLGYTYGSIETGGYINSGDVEQGVSAIQFLYFTNLLPVGRWQVRQFLWNRFTFGYNLKPQQHLNINEGEGLRVFATDKIKGTQKFVSNYEIDFFTPYKPLGFRVVGVLSADFALIGTQTNPLFNSRLFQGYGIGVRLRNEQLIFNTFELSLHYYPNATELGTQALRYYHTEHPYYRFQGFEASAPYTVNI